MIKRMLVMLVLFGVVLGGLFGFKVFVNGKIKEAMAGMANTPQTVSAAKAESSDWQPTIDAVGSLRAVRGADLSLEVPGVVEEILFQSGDEVQAGQILLRLRAEDEIAKLQSLEATAQLAQITYDRDVKQFKAQAISQAVVDNDEANLRNVKAQVAQQKAIVDKKTLRAPFAGRLGLRQVDLGQFLSAGTVIATLQSLDPIFVDFLLPQQAVAQLTVGAKVEAKVDAFPDRVFTGKITAINPKIETASRNIQVRATLPNADQKLLPGMFATVQLETGAAQRLITLPQTAVSYNPYGSLVYLVDDKGKGRRRQAAAHSPAGLRHHRRHARRPGGDPEGRGRGRHGRDLGPDQAAQRRAGGRRQPRRAEERPRAEDRRPVIKLARHDGILRTSPHEVHRSLHPPPGAGVGRQPADPGRRPARHRRPAGAAVSAHRERRGHGDDDLLRRRSRRHRGLHHHAARAGDRPGQRHRLHDLDQPERRQHHHRLPAG